MHQKQNVLSNKNIFLIENLTNFFESFFLHFYSIIKNLTNLKRRIWHGQDIFKVDIVVVVEKAACLFKTTVLNLKKALLLVTKLTKKN
jgi:hypothetical protein